MTRVHKIFSSLICGCLMQLSAAQNKHPQPCPVYTVQANHINVRQIEGTGIGYNRGYTTLEAFLTPFGHPGK